MVPCYYGCIGAILTLAVLMSIQCIYASPTSSNGINSNALPEDPEFTDVIENITVPAGRNIKLACSVKNLGSYKVAWIHFEQSAILTVHNHVITRNPRISVTHDKHDKHRTWFLHINNVKEEDHGRYMCQINTVTAKTQFGYVHVVVPPNIEDSLTSTDVVAREGSNVTLKCKASGSPNPGIKWKRDDNNKISISKGLSVTEWEGEILEIARISRLDMSAYLCIASNGVPPSVSKRIKVSVDFPPMVWIPQQLVGTPVGYNITLECFIEAYPISLNYWSKDDGDMIHDSNKYKTDTVINRPSYKSTMRLTISNVHKNDYGMYKCVAKNPRGETDGTIRLYSSSPPTTLAPPPTTTSERPFPDIQPKNIFETPIFRQRDNTTIQFTDKGLKYQSNLNEIDKSEQKSQGDSSSKVFEWPSKDESHAASGASSVSGVQRVSKSIGSFVTYRIPILLTILAIAMT
ncbi:lachesin-like [Sitodiplosis mosellana]|uniref:lachesin-like n=1 Tax=Sitodiplosis mosellana TaxID=263140 RepID=UPI002444A816|nr:lachesin-like [Sitodiplosis mosellana]XP_055296836.1 lachesin-like [Sitodiplosis mosellana]XP_055296837.1 lachesin-like [Sitodiplosis mosellana]